MRDDGLLLDNLDTIRNSQHDVMLAIGLTVEIDRPTVHRLEAYVEIAGEALAQRTHGTALCGDVMGRDYVVNGHRVGNALPDVVDQINAHQHPGQQHHSEIAQAVADQDRHLLRYGNQLLWRRTIEAAEQVGDAHNGGDPHHQSDDHQHPPADHLPIQPDHRTASQIRFERNFAKGDPGNPTEPFDRFVTSVDERQEERVDCKGSADHTRRLRGPDDE